MLAAVSVIGAPVKSWKERDGGRKIWHLGGSSIFFWRCAWDAEFVGGAGVTGSVAGVASVDGSGLQCGCVGALLWE